MPAKTPRLTFTPTTRTLDLIQAMTDTTGVPQSAVLRDMMEAMEDYMEVLVSVQRQVVALNAGAKVAATAAATEAAQALAPIQAEAAAVMRRLALGMHQAGKPAPANDGPSHTPASNTGVTGALSGKLAGHDSPV